MNGMHIGFVGTGQIGEPMVERLLAAGHQVSVFARRDNVRRRLSVAGARLVDNVDELAEVDVLACCLFSDEQVREVVGPLVPRLRSGSVFFSHTTGDPALLRELAEDAAERGVSVVDAPFSGNSELVRAGQLTVMLGGADWAVAVVEEAVGAYAGTILRTGPLGSALWAKLLNNLLFAACSQLTLAALETATSLGVCEDDFLAVLAASSGGSAAARYLAASDLPAARFAERLPHYLAKDVAAAVTVATEHHLDISALVQATRLGPMQLHTPDRAVV